MSYKYNKKWRLSHTENRNKDRKEYYTRLRDPNIVRRRWSIEDSSFIILSRLTDRVIHILIGRSVQAIQVKRCRLMKTF